ncbi:hypothetical protein D3C87_524610 [compost metagenome]
MHARGIFCLVFFLFFNFFLSQINFHENATLYNEGTVSNSPTSSSNLRICKSIIYVAPGTTIVTVDDQQNFKIVKRKPTERTEKKNTLEFSTKKTIDKKPPKKILEKKYVNKYYFSDYIQSIIHWTSQTKTKLAVLNLSNNKTKGLLALFFLLVHKDFITDHTQKIFFFSHFIFYNHHVTFFSVRPPPVVA